MGCVHVRSLIGDEVRAGLGEDVEAEIAASFSPFIGLIGQHGADEADDRIPVGKVPTLSVRQRISRLSRSLGLFDQIRCRGRSGNSGNVRAGRVEVLMGVGECVVDVVQESVELGVRGSSVELVIDRMQHRFHAGHVVSGVTLMRLAA